MTAILFAGPTLYGSSVPLPAAISLRPPARAGDIARAIAERPSAIGLVDGSFGSMPTVWHKEILDALDHGIAVLGAASLGALRAAECEAFGMIGVGRVFEAVRDGHILRDDAVLVIHAPAELGYRPLSIALVDLEETIRATPFPPDTQAELLRMARRMPFPLRTHAALARHFTDRRSGDPDAIAALLDHHASHRKRRDAEALIARLIAGPAAPELVQPPRLQPTSLYCAMLDRLQARPPIARP